MKRERKRQLVTNTLVLLQLSHRFLLSSWFGTVDFCQLLMGKSGLGEKEMGSDKNKETPSVVCQDEDYIVFCYNYPPVVLVMLVN